MYKQINLLLLIILALSLNVNAQRLTNSPYSRYGIGDMTFQGYGRSSAMGNTAIGTRSIFHLNKVNPASNSAILKNSFILEVGLGHKTTLMETQNNSQYSHNSYLNYFAAGFQFFKWWDTSFGLIPLSGVGYNIHSEDSVYNDNGYAAFENEYIGEGGINQLYWGNAFTFFNKLSLGINTTYLFGSIDNNSASKISETSFTSATYSYNRYLIKGFNYDLGIQYTDTIKSKKDSTKNALIYTIGGTFQNNNKIKTYNTLYILKLVSAYGNNYADTITNDTVNNYSLTLPRTFGIGFSLTFYDKFTLSADYVFQNWKNITLTDQNHTFNNNQFFGIGMEYCNSPFSTIYRKTIRYRVGAYYSKTYLKVNENQINDYGLTFGFGIPVKTTLVNTSFQFGTRGTIESGLLKESYIAFTLNFSLYDIWFNRFQFQ